MFQSDAESYGWGPRPAPFRRWGDADMLQIWLVDNSILLCNSEGLLYRNSKSMEDKDGTGVKWGSLVEGSDSGDGWIRVIRVATVVAVTATSMLAPPL